MSQEFLKGKWSQLKGKMQRQRDKPTDDDHDVAHGNADYLIDRLQERYGLALRIEGDGRNTQASPCFV